MRNTLTRFLQIALLLALTACKPSDAPAAAHEDTMVPLRVSILNYSDDYLDAVYVNESWAGSMSAHAGGGKVAGSAEVTHKWDPNYKLTIRWRDESLYNKDHHALYKREVATEPYQQYRPGGVTMLWVAFFPNGVLRLFPTRVDPGHEDFPEGLLEPAFECRRQFPGNPKCFPPTSSWMENPSQRKEEVKP
ncbi:DUF3304 domain-containing protein [Cupriavidus basilensis]|uniref:DUF3304 domain-containing protein n=1 Tax=Cupriavidus basilensis TaxID=68895 RepID=A0ABT6B0Z1_9BURK|nr:DUF3304 domain-containing protein [Cupriavidus basilensis]MDF3838288.1 DUF3304 domain-containing protein [Cupriavidus basilensis]